MKNKYFVIAMVVASVLAGCSSAPDPAVNQPPAPTNTDRLASLIEYSLQQPNTPWYIKDDAVVLFINSKQRIRIRNNDDVIFDFDGYYSHTLFSSQKIKAIAFLRFSSSGYYLEYAGNDDELRIEQLCFVVSNITAKAQNNPTLIEEPAK